MELPDAAVVVPVSPVAAASVSTATAGSVAVAATLFFLLVLLLVILIFLRTGPLDKGVLTQKPSEKDPAPLRS